MWYIAYVFFLKQKTAYEMRISDWSSDVCSSDLPELRDHLRRHRRRSRPRRHLGGALAHDQHPHDRSGGAGVALPGAPGGVSHPPRLGRRPIGRASCRERVCQYVSISVVAVSLKKKKHKSPITQT